MRRVRGAAGGQTMNRSMTIKSLLIGASLTAAIVASSAQAQDRKFNVPAGNINMTLPMFARQSGIQIIAPADQLAGVRSPAIMGVFDTRAALRRLIADANLEIVADNGAAITLKPRARAGTTPVALRSLQSARAASSWTAPRAFQAADASTAQAEPGTGSEIIVTATKTATTLNRVPISMQAMPQEQLDRRSIRSVSDIIRTVPALSMQTSTTADRVPSISIRGVASSTGAQTTGVYLDDAPLQKRNAIGISGSGTPVPALFDLERVEVLRGPQGTLYGGSSLGGTIRFITPEPSLEKMSAYARAEVGFVQDGGVNHDLGIALGGPLVEDRLGIRVSMWQRRTAGYIDHVDRFTGDTLAKDTNSSDDWALRGALLFKPTENFSLTPSVYYALSEQHDADTAWKTVPETTLNGYTYPAAVYGDYQTGANCNVGDNYAASTPRCVARQPRTSRIFLPSLKAELDIGSTTLTSVSSYISDRTHGRSDYSYIEPGNFQGGFPFVADIESYRSTPIYENKRTGFTQEVRFANDGNSRFNWVVGAFFATYKNNSNYHIVANLDDLTQAVFGAPAQAIFGVPVEPGNITYHRDQDLKEKSLAVFGEANFAITDKLKLIGGARVSREKFSYHQVTAGTFAGFLTPTTANGGLTDGKVKETPVTPKFGLQYQLDSANMLYATAAKGFRVGGVNQPPPASRCGADLAALGITSTPGTYKADSLWSYEVGAKLRSSDRKLSLNSSAFYIDWSNIQASYGLPTCGFGYVVNGGKAVSKGFDLEASVEPINGFTLSGLVAYTDAQYTQAVVGPAPSSTLYIRDGDRLPVSKWAFNVAGEYRFDIGSYGAYLRADWQHASRYQNSFGPGTGSFTPDTYMSEASDYMTARIGLRRDGWELSIFADNLLNSKDVLGNEGGRTGCATGEGAACTTYENYTLPYQYVTFRPRTIGATLTLRK